MFRTVVRRKTQDGCFRYYVCKGSGFYSTEVFLAASFFMYLSIFKYLRAVSFFTVIKSYCSQRNSLGTERENVLPGNLCIMKANVMHQQKAVFPIKKIFTYTIYDI